jgi:hypothetical protein
MTWQEQLWTELGQRDAVDRFVTTGQWITYVTQELLPELRKERRHAVLDAVRQEGWDSLRLAETVGSRKTTIDRLLEEGRALQRQEERLTQQEAA